MEEFGRFLNVVDVEATCWADAPPAGQVSEIIEIGICVIDLTTRTRVSRGHVLVRPARSEVSPFCTQLTGLTQDLVDSGIVFRAACEALQSEYYSRSRTWVSWGDYDRNQFLRQCAAANVPYPFGSRHVNAKRLFSQVNGLNRKLGMAQALEHAGIPLEGRHHSGIDDAWNIAALVLQLAESDASAL